MSPTDHLTGVMQGLLSCAVDALDYRPPGRAVIAPGDQVAWDDCCEGQVAVRLVRLTPHYDSRVRRPGAGGCGPLAWHAEFGLSLVRCVETVDDSGYAPSPEEITRDGLSMVQDVNALRDALVCCAEGLGQDYRIGQWRPLGPSGGCAGGEWLVTLTLPACACP